MQENGLEMNISIEKMESFIGVSKSFISYAEHRLVFLFMTGILPIETVDHEDGNGLNNIWNNLRLATYSQNSMNIAIRENNTSGATGVSFSKDKNKWKAYININRKRIWLGSFNTKEDAVFVRTNAEIKLHADFRYSKT